MKPHPRIRRTIKWGGAVVTVLLVVVWVGSGWMDAGYVSPTGWAFGAHSGLVVAVYSPEVFGGLTGIHSAATASDFHWWFWQEETPFATFWGVPAWILAGLAFLVTVRAWRIDHRIRRLASVHLCTKCHYDRTGLAIGAKCPECGSLPS